jgi:hypothetical protein
MVVGAHLACHPHAGTYQHAVAINMLLLSTYCYYQHAVAINMPLLVLSDISNLSTEWCCSSHHHRYTVLATELASAFVLDNVTAGDLWPRPATSSVYDTRFRTKEALLLRTKEVLLLRTKDSLFLRSLSSLTWWLTKNQHTCEI